MSRKEVFVKCFVIFHYCIYSVDARRLWYIEIIWWEHTQSSFEELIEPLFRWTDKCLEACHSLHVYTGFRPHNICNCLWAGSFSFSDELRQAIMTGERMKWITVGEKWKMHEIVHNFSLSGLPTTLLISPLCKFDRLSNSSVFPHQCFIQQ